MFQTLAVSCVTCIGIILSILFFPNIKIKKFSIATYWLIALLGAFVLILIKSVEFGNVIKALTNNSSSINPIKILVLFISMSILSIYLDSLGFFEYMANIAVKRSSGSQYKLFIYLYLIVSVLTIFTSNDIIILTFTPFICIFARQTKINPLPFLFLVFVAANTWSLFLIVGNPTNIYLATFLNVSFFDYLKVMFLPAILSGLTSFLCLFLIFRKSLKKPIQAVQTQTVIQDKFLLTIGIVHLAGCIILIAISSYIKIEMWLICLFSVISLFLITLIYKAIKRSKPKELLVCLKKAPWELIPFILSMFVIVLSLNNAGVLNIIASYLSKGVTEINFGVASYLASNVINNIPMSIMFGDILTHLSQETLLKGLYAAVIGSNLGTILTPIGALAGIMWTNILNRYGIKFRFIDFVKYGIIISVPTLAMSIFGLWIML
ncbi:MAG TPA: SLC13 family permease [Clostridia bacterium]